MFKRVLQPYVAKWTDMLRLRAADTYDILAAQQLQSQPHWSSLVPGNAVRDLKTKLRWKQFGAWSNSPDLVSRPRTSAGSVFPPEVSVRKLEAFLVRAALPLLSDMMKVGFSPYMPSGDLSNRLMLPSFRPTITLITRWSRWRCTLRSGST